MELRPGSSQTDVGLLPDEWQVKRLGDLGTFLKGRGVKKDEANGGDLPCIRYGEIYTHHADYIRSFYSWISPAVAATATRLRRGDLLFAGSGETKDEIGKCVAFVGGHEAFAGGDIVILRPADLNSMFMGYYCNTASINAQKASKGQGDAVVHISAGALSSIVVALPSPPEQQAIATALSDVDALLGGLDRLIAKKRDLKQAAIQQLLTGQTRLPGFHGEWEVKRLGDYATFLRNGVNSRAELLAEGRVKYLHYGDVHGCKDVYLTPDFLPCLPDIKAGSLDRLRDGDLIIADASEDVVGVTKSVEMRGLGIRDVVAGLHTIAARFDKNVLADGFKGFLQFCPPFATQLRRLAAGTKVYATNRANVASVEMRLPTIAEQAAIAAVLSDIDAEVSALEARRDKTRDLKQAMMQELLTGKTRLVPVGDANA